MSGGIVSAGERTTIGRLRERAREGDADAQYEMGARYKLGEGVPRDNVRALGWMLRAARQGDVDAAIQVVLLRGTLQPAQIEWAERWARKAGGDIASRTGQFWSG